MHDSPAKLLNRDPAILQSQSGRSPASSTSTRSAATWNRRLEGEVRFDKVSRALYSTDASVYQIEPLGVVVVKSREDVIRTVQICRQLSAAR